MKQFDPSTLQDQYRYRPLRTRLLGAGSLLIYPIMWPLLRIGKTVIAFWPYYVEDFWKDFVTDAREIASMTFLPWKSEAAQPPEAPQYDDQQ